MENKNKLKAYYLPAKNHKQNKHEMEFKVHIWGCSITINKYDKQ